MRTLVLLAARNLAQARRRTLLLGSAIAIVTMILVLLLALSAGVRSAFIESACAVSTGHVNVAGWFKTTPATASSILANREEMRSFIEKSVPQADLIVDRHRGLVKVISPTDTTRPSVLTGVDLAQEARLLGSLELAPTRDYMDGGTDERAGDLAKLSEPRSIALFAGQARLLKAGVGDEVTIRSEAVEGRPNAMDVRVVAVVKDVGMLGNWTLFASRQTVLELYQLSPETTAVFQIYLHDPERAPAVMAELRKALDDAGFASMEHRGAPYFWKFGEVASEEWTGQRLDLTTWRDEVSFLTWILGALDAVSFLLVAILLGIISIGIMNTMMMATRERTQEIGTLRAVGMPRSRVLAMILVEALVLGAAATTVGAVAGVGLALVLDAASIRLPSDALRDILLSDVITMEPRLAHVLASITTLTAVSGIAAAWPAWRAARLSPVTALQKTNG